MNHLAMELNFSRAIEVQGETGKGPAFSILLPEQNERYSPTR
jgi:hypothetical protein